MTSDKLRIFYDVNFLKCYKKVLKINQKVIQILLKLLKKLIVQRKYRYLH